MPIWKSVDGEWKAVDGEAKKICAVCCNIVKVLSIMMSPVLPVFSANLQKQLNVEKLSWDNIVFDLKKHKIGKVEMLIKKIERHKEEKFPLMLKIASVKEARLHPKSEKLIILQIDIGEEKPRQLVAGLQKHYKAEELIGKKIIVVSNLKPAKLGGELSQGMLLAASSADDSVVKVLEAIKSKPGDEVKCGSLVNNAEEIKYEDFAKLKIISKGGRIVVENHNNQPLKTDKEEIIVDVEDGYSVG